MYNIVIHCVYLVGGKTSWGVFFFVTTYLKHTVNVPSLDMVKRSTHMQEIGPSVLSRSILMSYIIDTCHFLVSRSALLGDGKDWLSG